MRNIWTWFKNLNLTGKILIVLPILGFLGITTYKDIYKFFLTEEVLALPNENSSKTIDLFTFYNFGWRRDHLTHYADTLLSFYSHQSKDCKMGYLSTCYWKNILEKTSKYEIEKILFICTKKCMDSDLYDYLKPESKIKYQRFIIHDPIKDKKKFSKDISLSLKENMNITSLFDKLETKTIFFINEYSQKNTCANIAKDGLLTYSFLNTAITQYPIHDPIAFFEISGLLANKIFWTINSQKNTSIMADSILPKIDTLIDVSPCLESIVYYIDSKGNKNYIANEIRNRSKIIEDAEVIINNEILKVAKNYKIDRSSIINLKMLQKTKLSFLANMPVVIADTNVNGIIIKNKVDTSLEGFLANINKNIKENKTPKIKINRFYSELNHENKTFDKLFLTIHEM